MTFRKYLTKINQLAIDNPELLQKEVVQASDDKEGATFTPVEFGASVGLFDEDNYEFILKSEFKFTDLPEDTKVNAVCIN